MRRNEVERERREVVGEVRPATFGRWESGRESVTRELYRGHDWRSQMAVSPMGITNGPASFEIRERGCVVVSPKASRAFYTPDWRQTKYRASICT